MIVESLPQPLIVQRVFLAAGFLCVALGKPHVAVMTPGRQLSLPRSPETPATKSEPFRTPRKSIRKQLFPGGSQNPKSTDDKSRQQMRTPPQISKQAKAHLLNTPPQLLRTPRKAPRFPLPERTPERKPQELSPPDQKRIHRLAKLRKQLPGLDGAEGAKTSRLARRRSVTRKLDFLEEILAFNTRSPKLVEAAEKAEALGSGPSLDSISSLDPPEMKLAQPADVTKSLPAEVVLPALAGVAFACAMFFKRRNSRTVQIPESILGS